VAHSALGRLICETGTDHRSRTVLHRTCPGIRPSNPDNTRVFPDLLAAYAQAHSRGWNCTHSRETRRFMVGTNVPLQRLGASLVAHRRCLFRHQRRSPAGHGTRGSNPCQPFIADHIGGLVGGRSLAKVILSATGTRMVMGCALYRSPSACNEMLGGMRAGASWPAGRQWCRTPLFSMLSLLSTMETVW
jgi:hypothetical protein